MSNTVPPFDIPRDNLRQPTQAEKLEQFAADKRNRQASTYFAQAALAEALDPENKDGSLRPGRDPYPMQQAEGGPWTTGEINQ